MSVSRFTVVGYHFLWKLLCLMKVSRFPVIEKFTLLSVIGSALFKWHVRVCLFRNCLSFCHPEVRMRSWGKVLYKWTCLAYIHLRFPLRSFITRPPDNDPFLLFSANKLRGRKFGRHILKNSKGFTTFSLVDISFLAHLLRKVFPKGLSFRKGLLGSTMRAFPGMTLSTSPCMMAVKQSVVGSGPTRLPGISCSSRYLSITSGLCPTSKVLPHFSGWQTFFEPKHITYSRNITKTTECKNCLGTKWKKWFSKYNLKLKPNWFDRWRI